MTAIAHSSDPVCVLEARLLQDFPQRCVDLPGGRIAIRECGQGPDAIVLLHGIGSGAASWLETARRLSGQARVIAWDAPGYGDSAPVAPDAPKATDYVERLLALLDALVVSRCLLVGHSLGAMMALAFAQRYPERLSRLVLISPAGGYGDPSRLAQGRSVRCKRLHGLDTLGIAGIAKQRAPFMLSETPSAEALGWVHWNMARLNPVGYRQAVELLCGDSLLHYGVPALPVEVLCGEVDRITTPETCRSIARHLQASFDLLPQAGHASHIEQPEVLAGRLASALDAIHQGNRHE